MTLFVVVVTAARSAASSTEPAAARERMTTDSRRSTYAADAVTRPLVVLGAAETDADTENDERHAADEDPVLALKPAAGGF